MQLYPGRETTVAVVSKRSACPRSRPVRITADVPFSDVSCAFDTVITLTAGSTDQTDNTAKRKKERKNSTIIWRSRRSQRSYVMRCNNRRSEPYLKTAFLHYWDKVVACFQLMLSRRRRTKNPAPLTTVTNDDQMLYEGVKMAQRAELNSKIVVPMISPILNSRDSSIFNQIQEHHGVVRSSHYYRSLCKRYKSVTEHRS